MPRIGNYICAFAVFTVISFGQTSAPAPVGGVETEWDLKKLLDSLSAGARRLKPMIDQANPQNWQDAQGGRSYIPQWKGAQDQIQYFAQTAEKFAREPERLTIALETFFRLQALESSITSLNEGVRRYQNPAVADLLQGALVENMNNRERLRTYLTELAQTKEQEFAIMDKEAQRCRGSVSRQPPTPRTAAPKPRSKSN